MSKVGQILTQNLNFSFHLSTFGTEKSLKSSSLKTKKNAQTLPKQLQNKFEKVQKMTFLTPPPRKTVKNDHHNVEK